MKRARHIQRRTRDSRRLTRVDGCMAMVPLAANAQVILEEDFESYTDTADLGGTWNLGDGTLDTGFGNPGQSLSHPGTGGSFTGANTNSFSFPSVTPTGAEFLSFSADIYDDASSANKRTTAGIRTASGANLIEMGMGPTSPSKNA